MEVRTEAEHGVDALVVGAVDHAKPHRLRPSLRAIFASKGVHPKRVVEQFKVSPGAVLPVGAAIDVAHFVPGQHVDVIGTTVGKGFAGVMKRHNMGGGNASHGATKMHRKMGATGGGQDPGRVWPGKRMAGHMGNAKTIIHSLQVYKIDTRWNVLYLHGAVPGKPGGTLKIQDARRKAPSLPLPTPTAPPGLVPPGVHVLAAAEEDPSERLTR